MTLSLPDADWATPKERWPVSLLPFFIYRPDRWREADHYSPRAPGPPSQTVRGLYIFVTRAETGKVSGIARRSTGARTCSGPPSKIRCQEISRSSRARSGPARGTVTRCGRTLTRDEASRCGGDHGLIEGRGFPSRPAHAVRIIHEGLTAEGSFVTSIWRMGPESARRLAEAIWELGAEVTRREAIEGAG